MPEGLEAELYRRAAEAVVGRTVRDVEIDSRQAQAADVRRELPGRTVEGVVRIGKHVLLELSDVDGPGSSDAPLGRTDRMCASAGPLRLDIHFGMTGRLRVGQHAPIERLEYGSARWNDEWNRLVIRFTSDLHDREPESAGHRGGGTGGTVVDGKHATFQEGSLADRLVVNDPRRWARFTLEPDLSRLGPDLFSLDGRLLADQFVGRSATLKAVLLNQSVIAGLGNMLVDELLLRTEIMPARPVQSLEPESIANLARTLNSMLPELLDRGGSHSGLLDPARRAGLGSCPICGVGELISDRTAGRTTVWCPAHQH